MMVGKFFSLSFESAGLGILVGLMVSWVTKSMNMDYDSTKQTVIMLLFAFFSFHIAEQLTLSGIISMFCCGLVMAHYCYWNISPKARLGTEVTITSIAKISQDFLYIYLGLSSFTIKAENVKMDFVYWTMGSILLCRVFSVGVPIFLCFLCSGCKPLKLNRNEWIFVYFGGLIRGAICFGLSL